MRFKLHTIRFLKFLICKTQEEKKDYYCNICNRKEEMTRDKDLINSEIKINK